ncbi:XRE family transcriptional regulator [Pseudonocardiaceae bacterium YIM PH 21723]|nr:XRE family transcriptional regulator [Pseudonocardiaceae bacterium YIM PH 21723]
MAGLTHQQVADQLGPGFSRAKISHIEMARVKPRQIDVKAMLALYGVTDAEAEPLLTLVKEANQKGWWDAYAAVMPETLRAYVGLESAASVLRTFQPQLVPGLLQTPEYARALAVAEPEHRARDVDRWVELRMTRQEVLSKPEPLQLWAILDEAALRRVVGGQDVMHRQLQHLLSMADEPHVTIQVLPFAAGAHPGIDGPFSLIGFPELADSDVVYLTMQTGNLYLERESDIARYNLLFDHLQASALPTSSSLELIRGIAKEHENDL